MDQQTPQLPPPAAAAPDRIFTMRNNLCILNTTSPNLPFYWTLLKTHGLIDMYHDQLDGGRGGDLKSKDADYRKRGIINNIAKSTFGQHVVFQSGSTNIHKEYNTETNGVHTLQDALERNGDDFFIRLGANIYNSPPLPDLIITNWNCKEGVYPPNECKNKTVVYKRFDTQPGCSNDVAGTRVREHTGINDPPNPEYGIVLDAGPNEVFQSIKGSPPEVRRNIMSGKLDSSSAAGGVSLIEPAKHQVYIPFMNIYDRNRVLTGAIMVYATWLTEEEVVAIGRDRFSVEPGRFADGYAVFLAFRYAQFTEADLANMYANANIASVSDSEDRASNVFRVLENGMWEHYLVTSNVPDLPLISNYMAGNRGCFSYIKNLVMGNKKHSVCAPYKELAIRLMDKIGVGNTVFATDYYNDETSDFTMAFLMSLKHMGDKFRVIDAFILSSTAPYYTTTGTIDGFLLRFACLSNLYVYCANKNGGNLTVNDVRSISPEEMAIMEANAEIRKCDAAISKYNHYRSLIYVNNAAPDLAPGILLAYVQSIIARLTDVIELIKQGILNPDKLTIQLAKAPSRRLFSIVNATTYYQYSPNKKIFSDEEMQSVLKYYLVLVQHHLYLTLFVRSNAIGSDEPITTVLARIFESIPPGPEIVPRCDQAFYDHLNSIDANYGNMLRFLENCYSIDYFLRGSVTYISDATVRNIVLDYSKFLRMNICAESSLKLVEDYFPSIVDNVNKMIEFPFETRVAELIDIVTNESLASNGIVVGGGPLEDLDDLIKESSDELIAELKRFNTSIHKEYESAVLSLNRALNIAISLFNAEVCLGSNPAGMDAAKNICSYLSYLLFIYKYVFIAFDADFAYLEGLIADPNNMLTIHFTGDTVFDYKIFDHGLDRALNAIVGTLEDAVDRYNATPPKIKIPSYPDYYEDEFDEKMAAVLLTYHNQLDGIQTHNTTPKRNNKLAANKRKKSFKVAKKLDSFLTSARGLKSALGRNRRTRHKIPSHISMHATHPSLATDRRTRRLR